MNNKQALTILILFITIASITSAFASENEFEHNHRFFEDRFIFLGRLHNKPVIASVKFSRGFVNLLKGVRKPVRLKYSFTAAFEGHVLYVGQWHHLKNSKYIETNTPFGLEEIPPYKPCIVRWKQRFKTGAINYDHQEISFLLQFRDVKFFDTSGLRKNFKIKTGFGRAVMLFQGQNVEGNLFYIRKELVDYNPFAHHMGRMLRRNFNRFFLIDNNGNPVICRVEAGKGLRAQWTDKERMTLFEKQEKSDPETGVKTMEFVPMTYKRLEMKWLKTRKESDPSNPFREYPVKWSIKAKRIDREPLELTLEDNAGYYWFNRGYFSIEGRLNGSPVWGLGEVIRGD